MRKYGLAIVFTIGMCTLVLSLGSRGGIQGSGSDDVVVQFADVPRSVFTPMDTTADYGIAARLANGDTTNGVVSFVPRDSGATATVLMLYNTTDTEVVVPITTIDIYGLVVDNATGTITIPAKGYGRICSDPVNSTVGAWQDTIVVNFTAATSYTILELSPGVAVDGYVVWNEGTEYDPLEPAHTVPLQFSKLSLSQ